MNDTELHSRLTALADELAPDADPYAQIADARGLHRRRQRARLGVAGAAVAVALVAVGVPAAVGTLSAPGDGDTAGPSTSPGPLRGPAGAVRSAMSSWDGSVPDPEAGLPCPDLTEDLSGLDSRHGFEASGSNTGGTLTGCSWATDVSGPPPGVLLTLRAAFDRGADELAEALDEDPGCPWATVVPGRTPNVLQVCATDRGQLWRLTVVDEDGTGSWVVTAAVDDAVPGRFRLAATSLATMWAAVAGPDDEADGST